MKFNKINYKRLLSTSLILIQVSTLVGCVTPSVQEQVVPTSNVEQYNVSQPVEKTIVQVEDNNPITQTSNPVAVTEPIEEKKDIKEFLAKLDSIESIDNLNNYYSENYEAINNIYDKDAYEIQLCYAASAYKKLKNTNIDSAIILRELHNLVVEQQLPRGMEDDEWQDNFGNISNTIDSELSLFDTYFCLAYMIHDYVCDEEHAPNELGAASCKVLVKEFQDKYQQPQL
jgi:hypothetical protein